MLTAACQSSKLNVSVQIRYSAPILGIMKTIIDMFAFIALEISALVLVNILFTEIVD